MRALFGYARYFILIAVIGLLLAGIAVFVFGGIMTVTVVVEAFLHAGFNAEGARHFSTELIELIDLFLLGTVMLIISIGLFELFIDPEIPIPAWLSVTNLEQLKARLVAVIIVMLTVLFLGAAAADWQRGLDLLAYGGGIALVILAVSVAVFLFQRVHQHEAGHEHVADHLRAVEEHAEG